MNEVTGVAAVSCWLVYHIHILKRNTNRSPPPIYTISA